MPPPYTVLTGPIDSGANTWGEYIVSWDNVLQECSSWSNTFNMQLVYQSGSSTGLTFTPLWGPFTMDDGWVGLAYDEEWWLEYAATPITYSVVSGSLPTGLTLSGFGSAGGKISGTPTLAGTYSFTLRATNAFGFADQAFSITINTPSLSGGGGSWTFFA
jgi:putative Ig domain-containing protein